VDAADAALLRADARRNLLAVARVIGWSADPRTARSRPTIARIMAATGLGKRTVQRWCRWLEARGLLEVLEEGTTPDYRPALWSAAEPGNLAREWRLTIAVHGTGTPPVVKDPEEFSPSQARARGQVKPEKARRCAADCPSAPPPPQADRWPLGRNPRRRSEQLAAAGRLRAGLPVLGGMPVAAVRSACRVFFAAGWTVADCRHALEHRPDGSPWGHTDPVRVPERWLAWRLAAWRGADGVPLRSAGQLCTEADAARKAEQAAFRAADAAGRSAAADAAAGPGAQARALLAAASPDAARVIALRAARRGRRAR
jgi:hypothetical protein